MGIRTWISTCTLLLGLLTGCGQRAATGRIPSGPLPVPMVTLSPQEIGFVNQGPRPGECRIYTYYPGCHAPLDGLIIPTAVGAPKGQTPVTLPAMTMRTRDGAVMVKAAVGNEAINDEYSQTVFGQLLVRGEPVDHARMVAMWHSRDDTRTCTGFTSGAFPGSCSEPALARGSIDGQTIRIDVTFMYRGRLYESHTSYHASSD